MFCVIILLHLVAVVLFTALNIVISLISVWDGLSLLQRTGIGS